MFGTPNRNEHSIRLRGGWDLLPVGEGTSLPIRLSLPAVWTDQEAGLRKLSRRFGRPPFDPASQALWLRMDHVPGLHSLQLNGQPLGRVSPDAGRYEFPLANLLERNRLDLVVDIAIAATYCSSIGASWGVVSLVIRPALDRD